MNDDIIKKESNNNIIESKKINVKDSNSLKYKISYKNKLIY